MSRFLSKFAGIELGKLSMFRAKHKLQFAKDEDVGAQAKGATDEEIQQQREEEIASLQGDVEGMEAALKDIQAAVAALHEEAEALAEQAARMQQENTDIEKEQKVRKRVRAVELCCVVCVCVGGKQTRD